MSLPDPVVFVPGITGTYLYDQYPVSPDKVWGEKSLLGWTTGKREDYERIQLHPWDTEYEAQEPSRVVPGQVFETAYDEFIEEVRSELKAAAKVPVPVFPFLYDWRAPIEKTQARLGEFINEVVKRTLLMPHYYQEYAATSEKDNANVMLKVSLVGHSMGGLVISGYLASARKDHRVRKVVTIATPFLGSCDSVDKIVTGKDRPRERTTARTTPATYYLLPSYDNAMRITQWIDDSAEPTTMFDHRAWQTSVLTSVVDYVRDHAPDKSLTEDAARAMAEKLFEQMLQNAKEHRKSIDSGLLQKAGMKPRDWLCIAGVDRKTRMFVEIRHNGTTTEVLLDDGQVRNRWRGKEGREETGDGTVPLAAAVPPFLEPRHIVCVRAKYGGVRERLYGWFAGAHAMLLNTTAVQRWSIQHLRGENIPHEWDRGHPAPSVTPEQWSPAGRGTSES